MVNLAEMFWKGSPIAKHAFLQMNQLPHYKAFYNPWCHFIFGYVG
jgi:hypothetical protein